VSPDGRNVYVAAAGADAVAVFSRNAATGVLHQLTGSAGCVAESADGGCAAAHPLFQVSAVAVSPDGRNVYAAGPNGVAIFSRSQTGALSQAAAPRGCVTSDESDDGCTGVVAMDDPSALAVSPDGRNLYVASGAGYSVVVLARDNAGGLSQLAGNDGCVAPPSDDEDEVPQSLPCTLADVFSSPPAGTLTAVSPIAVSPDGRNVYVASNGALAAFRRSPTSGALSSAGCLASSQVVDSGLNCQVGRSLGATTSISLTPDGRTVLVSSSPIVSEEGDVDSGMALMRRDPTSGALQQPPGASGCATASGSDGCATGRGLAADLNSPYAPNAVSISPDGRNIYVATTTGGEESGTIAALSLSPSGSVAQLPNALGCLGDSTAGCTPVRGLTGANSIAVSPDGRNVYATGYFDDSVVSLLRTRPTTTITVRTTGNGSVRSTPAGLQCPKRCTVSFSVGETVTFIATPRKGVTFSGWTGLCKAKVRMCKLVVTSAGTIGATFHKR